MFSALIAAGIILAQAAPAAGPQPSAAPPASTVSPLVVRPDAPISKRRQVDLNELVCHDELPPGTRFATKVCATRGQFLERTRQQQELVREWQSTPKTTSAQ